ncbi:UNVERIFIED_CONTAM: hypothetical protein ABID98_005244 [Brevibacillus sp. OAP136]
MGERHDLIENPIYSGQSRWNYRHLGGKKTGQEIVIEGKHESLIEPEEQTKLLELAKKRLLWKEKTQVCFPFTGILRCARCGNRLHGNEKKQKTKNYRAYRCRGRFALGICDLPVIAEDTIEQLLLKKINVLIDGSWKIDINVAKEETAVTTVAVDVNYL